MVVLLLFACNDEFLDVAPRDKLSGATFWRNEEDVNKALVSVYEGWGHRADGDIEVAVRSSYLGNTWSDDAITTGSWNKFYYNLWGLGNISIENEQINSLWKGLYKSIRRANIFLDNIHLPKMDENLRARFTGEAKFIRAYQYHILLNNFGGVPLVDRALRVDELKIPRADESEILDFIIKDLDDASNSLPNTPSETGRITKGAALALKARVLLYAGRWNEAAIAAKQVMDLEVYNLFQTPSGDGFQKQFATVNNNNSEQVISWQYLLDIRNNEKPNLLKNEVNRPTPALVNAFDSGDPRLGYSIAQDANSKTGYACVKFSASDVESTNTLIRYAEVLLTYAEAKIEMGSIDQTVLDAINKVKARAYGADVNDTSAYPAIKTTDKDELRNIVRNERRVELAFEGLRWFDIRRWKIGHGPNGTMNGTVLDPNGNVLRTRNIKEKDYLRPIPQNQIDLSEGLLKQNPGY